MKGFVGFVYLFLGFIAFKFFIGFLIGESLFSDDRTSQQYASFIVKWYCSNPNLVSFIGSSMFGYVIYMIVGEFFGSHNQAKNFKKKS